jgi:hypothetical protein
MTINEGDPALRGTARSHPPPNQGHSASDLALSFPRTHLCPLRHRPGLKLFWTHSWPLRHRQACQDSPLPTPPPAWPYCKLSRTHLWPFHHRPGLKLSETYCWPLRHRQGLTFGHYATDLALSFPGLTFGHSD